MKLVRPWFHFLFVFLPACTTPEAGADRRPLFGEAPAGPETCQDAVCDPNATCNETAEGAECVCREGFEGDGAECTDVDECADAALNDCDESADCTNTPGGFRCACKPGFSGDGRQCSDVDECQGAENTCDPNAICVNTESGFTCECQEGFSGDGVGCADIDECSDPALFSCADNAHCENIFGGFSCECDAGFSGDGTTLCSSLCDAAKADPSVCAPEGLCRVQGRTASCDACAPGFSGDGQSCTAASCDPLCDGQGDDDAAHAVCSADGTCACAPGYEGTVGSCVNVDECSGGAVDCGQNAECLDLDGGYACQCLVGYEFDDAGLCVDVDECAAPTGPCHPDATCTNVTKSEDPRGYTCACKAGFTGDGTVCADIDECATDGGGCVAPSVCVNQRGSSTCACQAPLVGESDNCHCDLSGFWAMRHDLDTCWAARAVLEGTTQNLISAGSMEASVWELYRVTYDGTNLAIQARSCGADNTPDLVSPLFRETYSAYVPFEAYDKMTLGKMVPMNQPGIVPGTTFSTPSVAGVLGIDLGPDPLNAPWPTSYDAVPASSWLDPDQDGEPGMTLWSRTPSETTDSGTRNYSYLPARPVVSAENLYADQRAGCVSVAARVIGHLDLEVADCGRITGEVINEQTNGRVHSCALVPKGTCDPDNLNDCDGWDQDIACTPEYWQSAPRCSADDLERLDDDQNQEQDSKATFEMIKIGEIDQVFTCSDVRTALPAIERLVPTITCTTPQ